MDDYNKSPMAVSKTFKTTIVRDGSMCFIPLTFDPASVFGKIRAPVKVTLNGYTYRSTIAAMGGPPCVPLRRSNREAAGLEGGMGCRLLDPDADVRPRLLDRFGLGSRAVHIEFWYLVEI